MRDEVVLKTPVVEHGDENRESEEEAVLEGSDVTYHIQQVVDLSSNLIVVQIQLPGY